MRRVGLALMLLAAAPQLVAPASAVQPDEVLQNPAQEARARALSGELRCMVCQNESIDDSDAPLARDLRLLVRQRIVAGDTDAAVLDFLTTRYGEFILLKPRLAWHNAVLWAAPFLVLVLATVGSLLALRRRRARAVEALSPDEQAALDRILKA